MKQLLSNQNIFEKLQRNLNGCLKNFYEYFNQLDDSHRQNILIENNSLFSHDCSQSDMFSAQIQGYCLLKNEINLTDGTVVYKVNFKDESVIQNANFFDTPYNSIVVIRKWSYELVYISNSFQINFVVKEMRCIDIITTIFYCKLEVDFTQGYNGINKTASLSTSIHNYSQHYHKAIQLLKQYLIHDTFISEFYNSTKTKSQPKLFIVSTLKQKLNVDQQINTDKIQKKINDDFGDGCLLQKISLINNTSNSLNQGSINKKSNYNSPHEVNYKKRSLPQLIENPPIIQLNKSSKLYDGKEEVQEQEKNDNRVQIINNNSQSQDNLIKYKQTNQVEIQNEYMIEEFQHNNVNKKNTVLKDNIQIDEDYTIKQNDLNQPQNLLRKVGQIQIGLHSNQQSPSNKGQNNNNEINIRLNMSKIQQPKTIQVKDNQIIKLNDPQNPFYNIQYSNRNSSQKNLINPKGLLHKSFPSSQSNNFLDNQQKLNMVEQYFQSDNKVQSQQREESQVNQQCKESQAMNE